jgi:pyridoxamine 5'-phosphate oxidase
VRKPFEGPPLDRLRRWLREARAAGVPLAEAMALATADGDGRPAARMVLLKRLDRRGLVFFTDARSRKGRELEENPRASALFYWQPLGRQVRVAGPVEVLSAAEAESYWATRPPGSRLSAATSIQSAPLGARSELTRRRREIERRLGGAPATRPERWLGFLIVPEAVEFWSERPDRLHHRELFRRKGRSWERTLLSP